MLKKLEAPKRPLWRKIIILPILPALIVLWMTGWTLMHIGSQNTFTEIKQKTELNHTIQQKQRETKTIDDKDENEIRYEPEIFI